MPAVAAIGAFLGTGLGAVVLGGVVSAVQASEQQRQVKRAEKKQQAFLAAEREAVGKPEDFEPGIREQFLEKETPRLEAEMAARGMTRSSEFERRSERLGVSADRYSREAALRRWQAQAGVAQRQVEQAFSNQQVQGPGIAESFVGGALGSGPVQGAISGATNAPIFSGATPGTGGTATSADRSRNQADYFGEDIFAAA